MWIIPAIISFALFAWIMFEGMRFAWLLSQSAKIVQRSQAFERRINSGSPRILVAGDSTAVGTGTTPEGSVAGHFAADFPHADIRNVSTNGWKVADLLTAFPTDGSFDLILLQIGANDIMRGTPEGEFETSLAALFDKATEAGTHVVVLHSGNVGLAPMFRWPASAIMRTRTLRYRAIYRRIASEKGVAYVDLYREKKDDVMTKDIAKHYASDLLHLTADGYGVWYDAIRKTMTDAGIAL